MAENDSTAGDATLDEFPAEFSDLESRLDQLMNSGDDRTKRLIFNRLISRMTEALPAFPPNASAKDATPEPAFTRDLLNASDTLREAAYLAEFVQSISLNVPHDGAIILQPGQLAGFFIAMQDMIARIKEAELLIDAARKQPEALPA